jgi:hypothetical protein
MIVHDQIATLESQMVKAQSDAHRLYGGDHADMYRQASSRIASLNRQMEDRVAHGLVAQPSLARQAPCPALSCLRHLNGSTVAATDGKLGSVNTAVFDDVSWVIRYLAVDTDAWMAGREILISPYSIKQPLEVGCRIDATLTREQVRNSPDIDMHQPISRQFERELGSHYAYPVYLEGGRMWGVDDYPLIPFGLRSNENIVVERNENKYRMEKERSHLRTSERIGGNLIQASDGSIGHVRDFIFDHETWAITYLVVDSGRWWQGSHRVLVATHWIDSVDWGGSSMHIDLTRQQIKESPQYHGAQYLTRDYEKLLHDRRASR